jgi:signal transduction histidine kinase
MNETDFSVDDFFALVNHNPAMISRINEYLVVEYVNDAICKFANMPREFFHGKTIHVLGGDNEGANKYYKKAEEVFKTGLAVKYQDVGWFDPNLRFEFEIIPLDFVEGKEKHVLAIIKDITDIKRRESELEKTVKEMEVLSDHLVYQNKLLQDFTYITSHNLRSPLGNLTSLLKLYEMETEVADKAEIFDKIKTIADKLSATVKELSVSISMRGEMKKEFDLIGFEQQLGDVKESLSSDLELSQASIQHDYSEVPTILYPKVYLESIFLNLLTNSIKYRSPKRPLEIKTETRAHGNDILLLWSDNGLGIDLEKHGSKLFGLKNTFHNHQDARGIGLYITRNQIESLGGSIMAEGQEDVGCSFKIVFKSLG